MSSESKSRVIHENLDTSFVNLWSLLRNLTQRGFIGRVHVELADYAADVFMTGSKTPLVHEVDRAAGTDTLEEAALHRLVLRARESPGSISVFEGPDEAVAVGGTGEPEIETVVASVSEPPATPPMETPPKIMSEPQESEPGAAAALPDEPEPDEHVADEPVIARAPAPSVDEPAVEEGEDRETIEWKDVVKISGELIGGIERALTGAGADFATLFNAARLELADDYTFLDPLSDGFEYSNSTVSLTQGLPANSYVAGLSEALRRVVDKVATGDRARRVRERVALELALLSRKRKELMARSGFRAQLDRIAGTKVT